MCSLGNALLRNLSKAYVATTAKIPGTKEANVSKSPKAPKDDETFTDYYDEQWNKDNLSVDQEGTLKRLLGGIQIQDLKRSDDFF